MESVHHFIKIAVPNYFRSLPIPKSIDGFAKLNRKYYNADRKDLTGCIRLKFEISQKYTNFFDLPYVICSC